MIFFLCEFCQAHSLHYHFPDFCVATYLLSVTSLQLIWKIIQLIHITVKMKKN